MNTLFILSIILIVLNLLIYINSEYVFNMLLYYISNDRYYNTKLNLGSSPTSFGNTSELKYSNELYTKVLTIAQKHIDNMSNISILEAPCLNINGANHIAMKFNAKQIICLTPDKTLKKTIDPYIQNNNQIEFVLDNPNNINKTNINNKNIDLILTIEASRHNYKYNSLLLNFGNFLLPKRFWVIADLFNVSQFREFRLIAKKYKLLIKEVVDISNNVLESINSDSKRKESFIDTFFLGKKQLIESFITTNSNVYNNLLNGKIQYLVIIITKV